MHLHDDGAISMLLFYFKAPRIFGMEFSPIVEAPACQTLPQSTQWNITTPKGGAQASDELQGRPSWISLGTQGV